MLLRLGTTAVCVLTVGLLGCQPAPDVPLSDSEAGSQTEHDHDHDHAHGDADHAHGHDHPHGDDEHHHGEAAEKSAMDTPASEPAKPEEASRADDSTSAKGEQLPTEIVLGEDAALHQGVPGEGPLTLEQVKDWLARPDV